MPMKKSLFAIVMMVVPVFAFSQKKAAKPAKKTVSAPAKTSTSGKQILPGAYQMFEYLPRIKGKRVGIFANHTAMVGKTHLVDTLQKLGVKISKIFGPEHGFRGTA